MARPTQRRGKSGKSESQDYTKYTEGLYFGVVTGQRFGTSSQKGTPYLAVSFTPTHSCDAVYPDDKEKATPVPGHSRETHIYISDGTLSNGMAIEQLRALGWEGTKFSELDPDSPQFVDLSGTEIRLLCKHEARDGKKNERWSPFTSRKSQAKENEKGVAAKLDAIFGADMSRFATGKPQPKPQAKPAVQPVQTQEEDKDEEFEDDDVFGPEGEVDDEFGADEAGDFDIPF